MSKYISIQIPERCNQTWDAMQQNTKGKFCNACQKTVIDFTEKTDSQLGDFFKKHPQNVCGMFYTDQLNRNIPIPKKTLPWLKYFFTITLPAFLVSYKSFGQKNNAKEKLELVNSAKGKLALDKITDIKKDSVLTLKEVVVNTTAFSRRKIMGDVTMGATVRIIRKKNKVPENNNPTNEINIYPNPIAANSILNIGWKKAISNNQFVEIFDANGNLIQKEMLSIQSKTERSSILLRQMAKGFYIISVTDTKTFFKMSKEFIVI